jgi:hypothetical protein
MGSGAEPQHNYVRLTVIHILTCRQFSRISHNLIMVLEIIIVRHGQTDSNKERVLQGSRGVYAVSEVKLLTWTVIFKYSKLLNRVI